MTDESKAFGGAVKGVGADLCGSCGSGDRERIYADFSLGAEREGLSLVDLSNPENFRTSLLFPFLWRGARMQT